MKNSNEVSHLEIIDTDEILTKDELKELKKLAAASKTTRFVLGVLFAIISIIGLPQLFEWTSKHLH